VQSKRTYLKEEK